MSIPFTELLVVLLVALLVIRPEKLPGAAATLGKWLKWLRQSTATLKREIEKPFEEKPHDGE